MISLALPRPRAVSVATPSLPRRLLGAFIVLAALIRSLRPAVDNDLGWHLRNGTDILRTGMIWTTDAYSGSAAGAHLNNFEWLWDVSVAALQTAFGPLGLVAVNALVVGAIVGCVYALLRLRGLTELLAALGTGLAMFDLGAYAEVRPGMTGALMAALFLLVLELFDRRRASWLLMLLVPLELVWVNCHASFLLGPALVGLYGLKALCQRQWRALSALAAVGGALVGASMVNPVGLDILRFTVGASRLAFNRDFVQEWSAPDLHQAIFVPLLISLMLTLALPLLLKEALPRPHRAVLLLASTAAVLQSAQFVTLYAIAGAPVLAEMLQQAIGPRTIRLRVVHALALVAALSLIVVSVPARFLPADNYRTIESGKYPVDAVEFINARQLQGPMWNDFDWGSWLIWNLPRIPVYVDGRAEMYGENFLKQYMDVTAGTRDFAPVFDGAGIRLAIISPGTALANELRHSAGWREDYSDGVASVFVRN